MPDIPYESFAGPVCRGDILLGNGCGTCEKCRWQRAQLSMSGDPSTPVHEPLQPKPRETMAADTLTIRRVANGWVLVPGHAGTSAYNSSLTHVAASLDELAQGVRLWATDQATINRRPTLGEGWEIKG